jgi:hypothetical protein
MAAAGASLWLTNRLANALLTAKRAPATATSAHHGNTRWIVCGSKVSTSTPGHPAPTSGIERLSENAQAARCDDRTIDAPREPPFGFGPSESDNAAVRFVVEFLQAKAP